MIHYRNTALTGTVVNIPTNGIVPTGGYVVKGWNIINTANTTDVYVKFYNNVASSVTLGTTTPVLTLHVPANGSVFLEANKNNDIRNFDTGMSVVCVTGLADSSTTAPSTAIHFSCKYE